MEPFTHLTAVAAPLDLPNVDTDRIIPARFLRKPRGATGYASFLFHDVRFNADGAERPEFVLNQAPYRDAKILVVAENFGCGSSREMAVWVLDAYGIRSVIAPSLGDIFHQNCSTTGRARCSAWTSRRRRWRRPTGRATASTSTRSARRCCAPAGTRSA